MTDITLVRGDTWNFTFQVGNRSTTAVQIGVPTGTGVRTLTDTAQAWTPSDYAGRLVRIESGPGAGKIYQILDNTSTVLTLLSGWASRPTTQSVYNILDVLNISAWEVSVTVKDNQSDTDANAVIGPLWTTLPTDANTAKGKGTVSVDSTNSALASLGKQYYDVQLSNPGTSPPEIITVLSGVLTVAADITIAAAS